MSGWKCIRTCIINMIQRNTNKSTRSTTFPFVLQSIQFDSRRPLAGTGSPLFQNHRRRRCHLHHPAGRGVADVGVNVLQAGGVGAGDWEWMKEVRYIFINVTKGSKEQESRADPFIHGVKAWYRQFDVTGDDNSMYLRFGQNWSKHQYHNRSVQPRFDHNFFPCWN